ncbi:MAG: hypothetical protein QM724_06720 [Flavobacteriales bacterium]
MRKILLLVLVLAVIGGAVGYKMYDRRPEPAAARAPDIVVPATDLYKDFVTDEAAAGVRYNDKVVQVSGRVLKIVKEEQGRTSVQLDTGDPLGAVVCEFTPDAPPIFADSSTATIKGFCAGYDLDVLLQRCSVVK